VEGSLLWGNGSSLQPHSMLNNKNCPLANDEPHHKQTFLKKSKTTTYLKIFNQYKKELGTTSLSFKMKSQIEL